MFQIKYHVLVMIDAQLLGNCEHNKIYDLFHQS